MFTPAFTKLWLALNIRGLCKSLHFHNKICQICQKPTRLHLYRLLGCFQFLSYPLRLDRALFQYIFFEVLSFIFKFTFGFNSGSGGTLKRKNVSIQKLFTSTAKSAEKVFLHIYSMSNWFFYVGCVGQMGDGGDS